VILLVGLFPEAVGWAIAQVDRGAQAAGRPRPHVAVLAYGAIDEDEEAALENARSIAAWFPQTAPHICDLAGLSPEYGRLIRAVNSRKPLWPHGSFRTASCARSRWREMANGPWGQIRAVLDAGADSVHVFPIGSGRMNTVRSFADAWRSVMAEL
jgi:5,10-methylenetetrahydromethanopterin reductase